MANDGHDVDIADEEHPSIALARTMWEAWRDGRIDDVLATMHPDVMWAPLFRPTMYFGHEGIRQMYEGVAESLTSFRTEVDDITLEETGTVVGRVRIFRPDEQTPVLTFHVRCVLRAGLIYSVTSYESKDDE